MLQTIAERGRALIDRTRDRREVAEQRSASLVQLCDALLSGRGEASGVALARELLIRYAELKTGSRIAFFEALAKGYGPDRTRLSAAATAWLNSSDDAAPPRCIGRPSRGGSSCFAASTWRRTARLRWCACASSCSTPWRTATTSRPSTTISSSCSRPGSTAASWCCAASTGRRRRACSKRSSATRRCTRSRTGTICAPASIRLTGVATRSSIRRWSTSR